MLQRYIFKNRFNCVFSDPDFVSSFDIGDKVYFFFRETAVEHINCGKVRLMIKSFEYVLGGREFGKIEKELQGFGLKLFLQIHLSNN